MAKRLEPSSGPFELTFVPEAALRAQFDGAPDAMAKSFAGLLLGLAAGHEMDLGPARSLLGMFETEAVK